MSGQEIDTVLEETVGDIDNFIQSELGFDPLSVTEPFTAAEIHSLSSILETRGASTESPFPYALENEATSFMPSRETSNRAKEVEVEIQIIDLKDVYDKKTKKTYNGIEYRLENSVVTVVVRASDEITSVRAYTQRCAEAAIRTHDTIGPVELDVNIVQSDPRCRVVTVDLGSVCKTREGDPVYWLEKAEVMQRNKWEMIIAMEFSSGLKGSVKSEAFRVTTKASYKMKRTGEYPDHDACALNRELVAFSLMEEDDCATQCQFAEKCRTELKSKSGPLVEEKILFQHHTLLDRHMVTTYYGHNPKVHYVVEQPELAGLLKLVGKRSLQVSAGHKANGRKGAEAVFWWACGHCFFERRKKSTIKAHIIQRVCQKPTEVKTSRKKITSRHLSQSELEEDGFKGYSWKRSLSV
ncbi:uncharacterized protein LOC144659684 isoform X2 [Oculina patagonica]